MLEKSPWIHSSNGDFTGSLESDAMRKNRCFVSDEEKILTPCLRTIDMKSVDTEFCDDVPVLGDHTLVAENTRRQYQLNDSSCTESDVTFFGDGIEDKGGNDPLFYGWPELENFEDVYDVFRNCDTTFGLDIDSSDHFSWLPSSHTIDGATDALMPSFDFPSCNPCGQDTLTEKQEVYDGESDNNLMVIESHEELTLAYSKRDPLEWVPDNHHIDAKSEIDPHVNPSKREKPPEGERRDTSSENGASFVQFDKPSEGGESNHLSKSRHNFSPKNQQQIEISYQPCIQTSIPMIKSNYSHPSNEVLPGSTSSVVKSELYVFSTISSREASHVSKHKQTIESPRDVSSRNPTYLESKKKRKSFQLRKSRDPDKSNLMAQRADSDLLCTKKPIPGGENEPEGRSEVCGNDTGFSRELDCSAIQESSCTSSEVSVDASSLKQLQHVMGQLDRRTKLCIRDSLYRLARSAAQRHNCDNHIGVGGDDAGALLSDGTIKSTGFIDIETDTNPIDRSIAHLLFRRPSDPSAAGAPADTAAMKSQAMIEPPNPPTAEKPVSMEETTMANEEATEQTT